MKIDTKRAWKALGIGALCAAPIFYVFFAGEGSEDTMIDALASVLMTPVMIFVAPLFHLAPFFEDPDRYLGPFIDTIPLLCMLFYALIGYGGLTLLSNKK